MRLKQIACILALLATGCTAAPTAVAPTAPTAPARKLLSVDSVSARMWGLRFNQTNMTLNTDNHSLSDCDAHRTPFEVLTWGTMAWCHWYTDVKVDWNHTGPGTFESIGPGAQAVINGYVSAERFIYTVPDGQVLVVNHLAGASLDINGFTVAANRDVEYRFGGGEVVLFNLPIGAWAEGYVGDEVMFTGSPATRGTAK